MKTALMTLSTLGLVFALSGPAAAVGSKGLSVVTSGPAAVVQQTTKCKPGEKWDEATQKCMEDKG